MNQFKKIAILTITLFASINAFAQTYEGKPKDIQQILKNIDLFSQYFMNGEADKMAACYTDNGKIFPDGRKIIGGTNELHQFWTLSEGTKILHHKITPVEIKIVKKTAYDYGYYEGETLNADGEKSAWKGKYVIVWKKIGKDWKMYLDIWNRVMD